MTVAEPKTFDGKGDDDGARVFAKAIVDLAINDEIDHRGSANVSETLACFLECRIAEALRKAS